MQELHDRGRESTDEEEIARALTKGEVAPAYHEPGLTVVVEGVGVEAGARRWHRGMSRLCRRRGWSCRRWCRVREVGGTGRGEKFG